MSNIKSNSLTRFIAVVVTMMFIFTLVPKDIVFADVYSAFDFVITSDKISVKEGEDVIITITANGPMTNACLVQYSINYSDLDFWDPYGMSENDMDSTWYADIKAGLGFGAVSDINGNSKAGEGANQRIYSAYFMGNEQADMSVRPPVKWQDFIQEGDDLYGKNTAVVGKIIFNALRDIDDVSECFVVDGAKNAYGDRTGQLASFEGTVIQLSDTIAVQKVKNLIAEIGSTVTYSSKAAIEAARTAYNAITNESLKAQIAHEVDALTAAEADLAEIIGEINRVKGLIVALAESVTDEKIKEAEDAYTALPNESKVAIADYEEKIQAAKDKLAQIKQEQEDKAAAAVVEAQIEALFPVGLESGDAIDAAQVAYDDLTEDQQGYVSNYERIGEAKQALKTLISQKEAEVSELIAQIPDEITNENVVVARKAIDKAKDSYDELAKLGTEAYVSETDIAKFEWALKEIVRVEEAVEDALVMDEAIEELFPITLGSGNAITAAETAFSNLSLLAKRYVTKSKQLQEARNIYNVINLINEIGEVNLESKAKIDSARGAYDALTEDEMTRVTNYTTLTTAEKRYEELLKEHEQDVIDQAAADGVEKLIEKIEIDEITLNGGDLLIKAAENAYESLTDEQKKLVENYSVLTQARDKYDALKKDQEAIDAVIEAIDAIGTVTYDNDCLTRIDDAQKAYDGLVRQELKDRVTNSEKLKAAKDRYDELKAEDEAVNNVIVLINDIGDVSATEECLAKITAARNAYDSLERADLKNRVTNIDALLAAEKAYEKAKLVINSIPVEDYDGKVMTVVTNVSEGIIVSCGTEKAAVVKIGEDIYHVFVTDYEISGSDIVLEEGTPAELMLGDVDGSGTIGANDARLVCGYIVRNEDALQYFDNLAFVKADVDGNGDINVLDAYVIAVAALNDPNRKVEFTILVDALLKLQ